MKSVLVTGSSGLIGSEVSTYFATELGYSVHGVDNNQRAVFFGIPTRDPLDRAVVAQRLDDVLELATLDATELRA